MTLADHWQHLLTHSLFGAFLAAYYRQVDQTYVAVLEEHLQVVATKLPAEALMLQGLDET